MQRWSAWMGAVFLTAGVTAALFAGAAVSAADTGSDSNSSSSASDSPGPDKPDKTDKPEKPEKPAPEKDTAKDPDDSTPKATEPTGTEPTDTEPTGTEPTATEPEAPETPEIEEPATSPAVEPTSQPTTPEPTTSKPTTPEPTTPKPTTPKKDTVVEQQAAVVADATTPAVTPTRDDLASEPASVTEEVTPEFEQPLATVTDITKAQEPQPLSATNSMRMAQAAVTTAVAPPAPTNVLDMIGRVIGSVIVRIGFIAMNALQAVEALVTGPPVLPPNSTVTVRSSTITLSTGQRVAANWYYPEGDVPPDRMILLSHGFLALGPMYSYTAANLAEQTHSIVVTPTLPSNFFAPDDQWLGGIGMAELIAELFVGDREALTQSAIDAGFATRYGLDPATAALPQKFGLAGHSLGGQLVTGVAGFLAENGAADDLVGVITLDGVPTGTTVADAIDKLDDYEADGGHYIPIREIGAPFNLFNSISNIKESLNAGRPGRYNGVVLDGGVHMDSMRGGNPLIQFTAYLVAGFPQAQNPPAVEQLAATWFNQWFQGQTDIGDDLVPGSRIEIITPQGTATGVVIGSVPTATTRRADPYLAVLSA